MPTTDYTDEWVSLFREHGEGMGIPDATYLRLALALGKPVKKGGASATGKHYRKPDVKTAKKILDSAQKNHKENSVSPGEAVGMLAAHSMSEVYTQSTLRTFHYAGLVGTLAPGEDIMKVVDTTSTMATRHIIALKPEYRNNFNEAKRIASKLQRFKLEQLFIVNLMESKDSEYEELIDTIENYPDDKKYVELPEDHPIIQKRMTLLGGDFDPRNDMYDPYNYSDGYEALLQKKKQYTNRAKENLEAMTGDNAYGYQIDIVPRYKSIGAMNDSDSLETPPFFMSLEELKPQLERTLENASGDRKLSDIKGWSFNSITILNNGDKITITIPKGVLPSKSVWMMALNFSDLLNQLEFCGGCGEVVTAFTVRGIKDRRVRYEVDEAVDETAKEHYENILKSLGREAFDEEPEFFDDEFVRRNPESSDDSLREKQIKAAGMVKVAPSPDEMFFAMVERYPNWRNCRECGGGWWNTATGVAQVKDYESASLDDLIQRGSSKEITKLQEKAAMVFAPLEDDKYEYLPKYPFAWQDHNFEPPTPDLEYEMNATLIDAMPANPLPGEFYIQVSYANPKYVWKGSIYCAGHFSHLTGQYVHKRKNGEIVSFYQPPTLVEAEPSRCLTTNLHQVEKTLGIEAARQMTYQVISQLYCGGQHLLGFNVRLDDRHMLLMADAYTSTGVLKGAPGSNSSISGVNATKGLIGGNSAVLAQSTYERPLDVMMKKVGAAAPMGVVDPLDEPMSAQIVGTEMKVGSGTHPERGRFALGGLFDARNASWTYDAAMDRLLSLFSAPGRSPQMVENLMRLPETHEMYPKRVYESEEYKEALQDALEAKKEYELLHGRVVEILEMDNLLMKANKK
jgi:hypothetical protein